MQLFECQALFANGRKKSSSQKTRASKALCEVIPLMEQIEPAFWGNKSRQQSFYGMKLKEVASERCMLQ